MKSKSAALVTVIVCLLTACTNEYYEVKKTDLGHAFILNSSPTFKGCFYQGSGTTYHYFISKWQPEPDKLFKINKSDLQVSTEKPYGQNEVRIFLMNPQSQDLNPFAVIGKQTIYTKK